MSQIQWKKKKKSIPDSFDLQSYLFTAHSQALVTKTELPPRCLFRSSPASDILKWSAATEGRVSLEAQIKGEKENILKPLQEGSASSAVPSVQLQQCCFSPDFECIYQAPSIAQGLRGDEGTWKHSLSLSFGVSLCRTCALSSGSVPCCCWLCDFWEQSTGKASGLCGLQSEKDPLHWDGSI